MRCSITLMLILLFASYPEANLTEKQKAAITVTISVGAAVGIVLLVKKFTTPTCKCSETDSVKTVRFCKTCLYNWPTNPIPKCAKFTKDQHNFCVVGPADGCECYEGQTKLQSSGLTCTCVAAADSTSCHWQCRECLPGTIECKGATTHRICQNDSMWGASENCPQGQQCGQGGQCVNQPCPQPPQDRECTQNGAAHRECQNGVWTETACPNGCLNGFCQECPKDGVTQCNANGVHQFCQNGIWTDDPCLDPAKCVDGNCVYPNCGPSKEWSNKFNKCVPVCKDCSELSDNGDYCKSKCKPLEDCEKDKCVANCDPKRCQGTCGNGGHLGCTDEGSSDGKHHCKCTY